MTPEGKVKAKCVAILKQHGCWFYFPMGTVFSRTGVPDILCCFKSFFLAIECKAGKNKCSPRQLYEQHSIRAAGGLTLVVNETNVGQLDELLCELEKTLSCLNSKE